MKIDNNYSVHYDGANNYTLTYTEKRIAEKGKNEGKEVDYTEEYYYPSVFSALKKYVLIKQGEAEDVKQCIEITENLFEKIKNLKFK